ncbi:SET and MYND domain-containing protein 4 isoform X2 [Heterodontus francisci]
MASPLFPSDGGGAARDWLLRLSVMWRALTPAEMCFRVKGARMQGPAAEWRLISGSRWRALPQPERWRFSSITQLGRIFDICHRQLDSRDEAILDQLGAQWQTQKDPRAELDFKQRGNARFKAKDYVQAMALYSEGLHHSSPGSPEAALLYANRSAALYHLQRYQECLSDIRRAQEHGYPQELEYKVLSRRRACLYHLGVPEGASDARSRESCHDRGTQSLQHTEVPSIQAHSKTGDLPCARRKASDPSELRGPCAASPSIALHSDASRGRYLAAIDDLRPGQLLLQEEAFAVVLIPEGSRRETLPNEKLYCHHCLGLAGLPVPCLSCSFSSYCSELCREQAWDQYHWLDCCLGGLLLALGTFTHLALRTVLVAGMQEVERAERLEKGADREQSEEWRKRENPNHTAGVGSCSEAGGGMPRDDRSRYQTVHSLLTHTEQQQPEHCFLCGFTAAAVCREIRRRGLESQVVGEEPELQVDSGKEQKLRMLGVAMLRHMLQLGCNAQAITAFRDTGVGHSHVTEMEQVRIATAFYSSVSLLNHSCQPNTSITFHNTSITVRASQQILAGQEVLHCYGPHWSRMALKERQQTLSLQYFFQCRCTACVNEEEEGAGMDSLLSQFLCSRCGITLQDSEEVHCTCSNSSCSHRVSKQSLFQQVQEMRSQLNVTSALINGHPDEALRLLSKCQRVARTLLSNHHPLQGEIEDRLAQVYASQGNWMAAARHLKRSGGLVQLQFGPESVEMGNQLFKLAQILFNG